MQRYNEELSNTDEYFWYDENDEDDDDGVRTAGSSVDTVLNDMLVRQPAVAESTTDDSSPQLNFSTDVEAVDPKIDVIIIDDSSDDPLIINPMVCDSYSQTMNAGKIVTSTQSSEKEDGPFTQTY